MSKMTLNAGAHGIHVELPDGEITILVLESPFTFTATIQTLVDQIAGGDGDITLYDDSNAIVALPRSVRLITDPVQLPLDDKSLMTPILARLQKTVLEEFLSEWQVLQETLSRLGNAVLTAHDDLHLVCETEPTVSACLKMIGIRMDPEMNFIDRLALFVDLTARFTKVRLLVFSGLLQYLSEEDLARMREIVARTTLPVLLLERVGIPPQSNPQNPIGKEIVIDADDCIIL